MPAPSGFDHVPTTKSNSARGIAAHPFDKLRAGSCRKRKNGAPSVGMVHAEIVKGGPTRQAILRRSTHLGETDHRCFETGTAAARHEKAVGLTEVDSASAVRMHLPNFPASRLPGP